MTDDKAEKPAPALKIVGLGVGTAAGLRITATGSCTEDHDHGDHEHGGHDHAAHDHAAHDHAADDHAEHDHAGHDHSHDHAPRALTRLLAEDGGPAMQWDIEALLPGETDEDGRFAELVRALTRLPGVTHAHLRKGEGYLSVCVHLTADATDVEAAVLEAGARISRRFKMRAWLVRGMDSVQCGEIIEHALHRTTGVLTASVAYAAERLVVEYDSELVAEADIERRLDALGYTLEDPPVGHVCAFHGGGDEDSLAPRLRPWLVGVSGALIAAGWALELLVPVPGHTIATFGYAIALACAGYYPAKTAVQTVRQLRADIETLTVLAAIGAGLLGAWFEGAFLLFLFSLGHALEHRAMDRAREAVDALATLRPSIARVRRGASVVEVPASEVRVGDVVVVRPGDRVAVDGAVVDGASSLDQAAITGESVPVAKAAGDPVFAGSVNGAGALEIRATKLASQSTLARLVDMVASAEARKSPDQRLTTRLERWFVPIVLAAAPLLSVGLAVSGMPLKDAVLRGLALLVAASPCALAVAAPSAVLSAVARAAAGGVLIKGGADLHALGTVRVVAFDKTGTLTHGRPRLISVVGTDERRLLATAAGAEALSGHPLAAAIRDGARDRGIDAGHGTDLSAVHGSGILATVDGDPVRVGRAEWFGALSEDVRAAVERLEAAGQTTMVVERSGQILGVLGVADTLRAEAADTIRALEKDGIERTIMLSGDNARVAAAIGASVGIREVKAPLLPEEKVRSVRELARRGGVAMVGDGVNDAPALATASVGVSLGGAGSDVALQTADVVLMGDDLRKLPFAVGLARAANQTVRANIVIALSVAAVLVVASALGFASISHAVVLHEGSTLVVVFNGLRLLRWRER